MSTATSLELGFALAALGAFAGWRGARPPNPMKGPRLVPWRAIMLLCATLALILIFGAIRAASTAAAS